MEINFPGTITDLRKASATLTGKFCPEMHDVMSLFMGHSRKTHEKYYRIHLGHDGLINVFMALEKMQSQPQSTKLDFPFLTADLAISLIEDKDSADEINKSSNSDCISTLNCNSLIQENHCSKYDSNLPLLISNSSSSNHSVFSLNYDSAIVHNIIPPDSNTPIYISDDSLISPAAAKRSLGNIIRVDRKSFRERISKSTHLSTVKEPIINLEMSQPLENEKGVSPRESWVNSYIPPFLDEPNTGNINSFLIFEILSLFRIYLLMIPLFLRILQRNQEIDILPLVD